MDNARLHEGMVVYGSQGEKLGKVVRRDEQTFVIEKGTFFRRHKQFVARYDDVAEVAGDEVRLSRGEEVLGELARGAAAEGPLGDASPTGAGGGAETIATTPVSGEPASGGAPPRSEPKARRDVRGEDETGATVTYGVGEDSGSPQARREDVDEG